tara:strand:+ start:5214 stop:6605 length:1392 start_codon:yes stop_codon:yes gene_type:complete
MAIIVNQETTGVQGTADDLIYVVKDDAGLYSEINFRYVCSVRVDGAEVIQLKQLPNNAEAAVFNTKSIASNYVYQDENPYQLGAYGTDGVQDLNKIFAPNTSALKTFTFRFGYEYSATAADIPTVTLDALTDTNVIVVNGTFLRPAYSSPSTGATAYALTSSDNLLLSDLISINSVIRTSVLYGGVDRQSNAALAFLNGDDVGSTGSGYIHVSYYNGASLLNTGYFTNTAILGGAVPAASLSDENSLIYFGCGPSNLYYQNIVLDLKPSNVINNGWTHYDVQMASTSTLSTNETSAIYRFERVSCGRYVTNDQIYSLHWWNSKGGIDNLPMLGKVTERQSMDKKDFRTSGGNSFSADGSTTDYVKQSWEGGKRSAKVHTTTTYELTTIGGSIDQLTPMIRSLVNSERAYLSGRSLFGTNSFGESIGVVQAYIKDASVQYLSNVNDQAKSYKVMVEVSRLRPNP